MITEDDRLDRTVTEEIATTTTFTENDLERYEYVPGDRDYEVIKDQIGVILDTLSSDLRSRRAIVMTDRQACIVGVQVLVRDYVHVLAWLRSSDANEYRNEDIGFLAHFGRSIRDRINTDGSLRLHIFTSSLHEETQ